ncbi:protein YgfX [Algicola sagamiensis]|uniref:protein YgfX n=1 Tax=Algicola sagamiensis TaxID=163869 RepID=UPI00037D84D7|nr:protein YgfX [Algicola sagamiensis]
MSKFKIACSGTSKLWAIWRRCIFCIGVVSLGASLYPLAVPKVLLLLQFIIMCCLFYLLLKRVRLFCGCYLIDISQGIFYELNDESSRWQVSQQSYVMPWFCVLWLSCPSRHQLKKVMIWRDQMTPEDFARVSRLIHSKY